MKEMAVSSQETYLALARKEKNPVKKQVLLAQAERIAPDDLAVQKELLMLGDLYRRDGKNPDPRLIKCYLFHIFEHPESHDEQEQEHMAREIFDHPRLQRCLALSPAPQEFMKEYLHDLSDAYIEMFIRNERAHVPSLFGFVPPRRLVKFLSLPAADVIRNIFLCPFLAENEQSLLAGAFYRAFYQYVNGHTENLDEALGEEIRALIQ
ncbi:MAG: hypothetical protein E7336_03775 [Clostridiales bacterium]|nr:hypothetical protein [Clostridiales bacterium]